jgi:hypothetical protein
VAESVTPRARPTCRVGNQLRGRRRVNWHKREARAGLAREGGGTGRISRWIVSLTSEMLKVHCVARRGSIFQICGTPTNAPCQDGAEYNYSIRMRVSPRFRPSPSAQTSIPPNVYVHFLLPLRPHQNSFAAFLNHSTFLPTPIIFPFFSPQLYLAPLTLIPLPP